MSGLQSNSKDLHPPVEWRAYGAHYQITQPALRHWENPPSHGLRFTIRILKSLDLDSVFSGWLLWNPKVPQTPQWCGQGKRANI